MTYQQHVTRDDASGASVHASRADLLLDDVRRAIAINPEAARAAALRLASWLEQPFPRHQPPARGGLARWQKRKLTEYIEERLDGPLRSEELAEQAALSVSHFCRAFKESFGMTPHAHIMMLRLELAKRLISNTHDPLSQIACACGLADQSHLTRLFRRHVGQTPHAWRRVSQIEPRVGLDARVSSGN